MTFGFSRFRPGGADGNNKFRAVKQEYKGLKYDSKLEVGFAQQLDTRIDVGEKFTWRRQVLLDLKVNGKKVCGYKMDFILDHGNDCYEMVETKGMPTEAWKIKWRLLEILVETEEFRTQHGFPKHAEILLTLVAAQRVKNWAAHVRNTRRKKRVAK